MKNEIIQYYIIWLLHSPILLYIFEALEHIPFYKKWRNTKMSLS